MRSIEVKRSSLSGRVVTPPSKSHTLRGLVFALMAEGVSTIENYLASPDTWAMVAALEAFGAKATATDRYLEVLGTSGRLDAPADVINCGNSGQVLRFMGALSALQTSYVIFTGDRSIRESRPIQPLLKGLSDLGALAVSSRDNGHAPIVVKGPLKPGVASVSGEDSQPVSALLIASAFLPGKTEILVTNPGEKPWIDLTISWLERFNIKCTHSNYKHYVIEGISHLKGFTVSIPGDFSTAAFPLAAAIVTNSEITLANIDMDDVQGDKKLVHILMEMGAHILIDRKNKSMTVKRSHPLKGIRVDINDCIDALPILAVVGCFAEGRTEIVNAAIARKKESDRIHSIAMELKKMGALIQEREDGLVIEQSNLKGHLSLTSHKDHRIAMSLAVAAMGAMGASAIKDVECIGKTYPTFIKDFENIGCHIKEC